MRFGFNYGVGKGSGRYRNNFLVSYLMDTVYTDGAMDRFLDNVGSYGSNNDAPINASNLIYLNGTTQSVPYPVLHDLGADVFTSIGTTGARVTATPITDGYNIVGIGGGTDSSESIGFDHASVGTGKVVVIGFDCSIVSGEAILDGYYDGTAYTANPKGFFTLVNGYNEIVVPTRDVATTRTTITKTGSIQAAYEVDITNITVQEITLPTASYLTYFDSTTNTLTELSATGDRGATLPVSTTYSVTDSHQFALNHTSPFSDDDITELKRDANLIFRVWFNAEVLPSGFAKADMGNFFGGNEGLASGAYVQDLGTDLGSEEVINPTLDTDITNWQAGFSAPTISHDTDSILASDDASSWSFSADLGAVLSSSKVYVLEIEVKDITISASKFTIYASSTTIGLSADGDLVIEDDNPSAGDIITKLFSPTRNDLQYVAIWSDGGGAGLININNLSVREASSVEIQAYDSATRTTLANQSNGATNLKLIKDGSGRTTGVVTDNTTRWYSGDNAPSGLSVVAPYTITEIIGADTYTFTSDLNRYKNGIADGTFTAPVGVWTLGEFSFDGVTPTPSRGKTDFIDAVVIP